MKIISLVILAATPISAMALPANVTHAPVALAPYNSTMQEAHASNGDHSGKKTKIAVGCVFAATCVGMFCMNFYRTSKNGGAKL